MNTGGTAKQSNNFLARPQSSAESLLAGLLPAEPFLHLLDFGLLKRALHDSSKVFVQFLEHSNSRALATAGSVMTIGVKINKRMLALPKNSLTRENKID